MSTITGELGRLEQERAFHDDRYRDDQRAPQDKFYVGLDESEQRFQQLVGRFRPGQRVLELGCGIDTVGYGLAAEGIEVVGIDLSPVAVEKAEAEARVRGLTSLSFEVMNAEALEFETDSFDGVIGTAVLHHLDVAQAYAGVSRVLTPAGRAVFIEPLGHNPLINAYRRRTPDSRTAYEHPLRCEDFSLGQRFFQDVEVDTFHLLSIAAGPVAHRRGGRTVQRALSRLDRTLMHRFPALRWQAWIAVAELRRPK